jgi:succinate-semialdehyde dehydrogenase/glutarate-semialdehyde dehydrogenase
MTQKIDCINPATKEVIASAEVQSVEDLKRMVSKANEAHQNWAALNVKKRVSYIKAIKEYLIDNKDALIDVIAEDNGKLRIDALTAEILPSAIAADFYIKKSKKFLKERRIPSGSIFNLLNRSRVRRVPFGVIGVISPWNYPFTIAFSEVIMGLISGNCVILKTASETQAVGNALKKAIDSAGLPEGVFQYINIPGRIAGDAFLESGIDKLFFTGSVSVGKKLMAKAAETLTPVNLELGGNDAMLVCEDADPYRAAAGALWAGFSNAGQSCGGVERIYVHEKIYKEFMEELKKKIETLRVGYGEGCTLGMGCMTTERQIEAVKLHINDALERGARIFVQSEVPLDTKLYNFIPATVLSNVDHSMLVMREETFGPVVGVMKVKDMNEALELANDSPLGLTGSVWSKNRRKAEQIGRRIQAGVITVNDHLMRHGLPGTSWGGFKESGIGRTHGEFGFNEMTQVQIIVSGRLPFVKKNIWWHPYDERLFVGLKGLMDFLMNRKLGARFRGMFQVLRLIPRMFHR